MKKHGIETASDWAGLSKVEGFRMGGGVVSDSGPVIDAGFCASRAQCGFLFSPPLLVLSWFAGFLSRPVFSGVDFLRGFAGRSLKSGLFSNRQDKD